MGKSLAHGTDDPSSLPVASVWLSGPLLPLGGGSASNNIMLQNLAGSDRGDEISKEAVCDVKMQCCFDIIM